MTTAKMLELVSPVAPPPDKRAKLAPPVDDLHGKSIGFRIQWNNFDLFMQHIEEKLQKDYQPRAIPRFDMIRDPILLDRAKGLPVRSGKLQKFIEESDVAILGLAA